MHAGLLWHTVTIETKVISATGDRGQPIYTWQTLATVPAQIEELTGRKLELARQLQITATHKVTIRYLSTLSPKDRISYIGRVFNIGYVINLDLKNFTMELFCTEAINNG